MIYFWAIYRVNIAFKHLQLWNLYLHRNKENESENDYRKDEFTQRNLDKFGYDFEQLI
jgi:hypothetical protein